MTNIENKNTKIDNESIESFENKNSKLREKALEHHHEYDNQELSKHELKEIIKVDKLEHYYEKPLHFHFLRTFFHFVIIGIAISIFTICLKIFIAGGVGEPGGFRVTITGTDAVIMSLLIVLSFAIAVAEFTLAMRRLFRIGRYERIIKANEKHKKALEKFKKKHMPKLKETEE